MWQLPNIAANEGAKDMGLTPPIWLCMCYCVYFCFIVIFVFYGIYTAILAVYVHLCLIHNLIQWIYNPC